MKNKTIKITKPPLLESSLKLSYPQFLQEMRRELARHERKRNKLESRLAAFQAICKHEKTIFQPDPSGNNDSSFTCLLCNKEL